MGMSDNLEDEEFAGFLRDVISAGGLDEKAAGITKLVLDKGVDALSDKQRFVYQKEVLDVYAIDTCERCGGEIPWCEKFAAYDNGRLCSWCNKMMDNDD